MRVACVPSIRSEGKVPRPRKASAIPTTRMSTNRGGSARDKKKILFLCLGNICRSPTAEAVFKSVVEREGLAHEFEIDSCGTGGGNPSWYVDGGWSYHEGNPADSRMTTVASARGVKLTSRSRPLKPTDLEEFDMIVGMDPTNKASILTAVEYWHSKGHLPKDSYDEKIRLMCEFLSEKYRTYDEVPDPYFGGMQGFELVLDLLDDACVGLLNHVQETSLDG